MKEEEEEEDETSFVDETFDEIRCINLRRRPDRWKAFISQSFVPISVKKFEAVDGMSTSPTKDCQMEWDATQNAKYDPHIQPPMKKRCTMGEVGCTLSHVTLWKELLESKSANMLILEDDAIFHPTFSKSFPKMWKLMPSDWDIVYLGFCNVGPTTPVLTSHEEDIAISIVRPSYGFYTHAYALRTKAAIQLVSKLPVVGPIDTWLADNRWFDLNVYYGVMGKSTCLIGQRRKDLKNDIVHSAHSRGR